MGGYDILEVVKGPIKEVVVEEKVGGVEVADDIILPVICAVRLVTGREGG